MEKGDRRRQHQAAVRIAPCVRLTFPPNILSLPFRAGRTILEPTHARRLQSSQLINTAHCGLECRAMHLRAPKDFWSGIMFLAFAAVGLIASRDYSLGTSLRMGPGYFPILLGSVLALLG